MFFFLQLFIQYVLIKLMNIIQKEKTSINIVIIVLARATFFLRSITCFRISEANS